MTERLPGGGKPWFERRKKIRPFGGTRRQIAPCSAEGWLVLGVFIAVTTLSVLILLPEPTLVRFALWGSVQLVAVVLLVVIAFRMSPPVWRDK